MKKGVFIILLGVLYFTSCGEARIPCSSHDDCKRTEVCDYSKGCISATSQDPVKPTDNDKKEQPSNQTDRNQEEKPGSQVREAKSAENTSNAGKTDAGLQEAITTKDQTNRDELVCRINCQVGETRCQGNTVEICVRGGACNRWIQSPCKTNETCNKGRCELTNRCSKQEDCQYGFDCISGYCIACPTNVCKLNSSQCQGTKVLSCVNQHGCYRWKETKQCSGNQVCLRGVCVRSCKKHEECYFGEECNQGLCSSCRNLCKVGEKKCDGDDILECVKEHGCNHWKKKSCGHAQKCVAATCELRCTSHSECPSDKHCSGGICQSCTGQCTPNEKKCNGNKVLACQKVAGCWNWKETTCPASHLCKQGTCEFVCQSDSDCSGGKVCSSGKCRDNCMICKVGETKCTSDGKKAECIQDGKCSKWKETACQATPKETCFQGQCHAFPWLNTYQTSGYPQKILIADDDHIYITGTYYDPLKLGSITLPKHGSETAYIAKLTKMGKVVWAKALETKKESHVISMTLDPSGNIVWTGKFREELTLGSQVLKAASFGAIVVGKFDPQGKPIWTKGFGLQDMGFYNYGDRVATDKAGNIFLMGRFGGTIKFGSKTLTSNGESDLFVTKLSPQGTPQFAMSFGGPTRDKVGNIQVNSKGDVVFSGVIHGSYTVNGTKLGGYGNKATPFIATYSNSGALRWFRLLACHSGCPAHDMIVGKQDKIYFSTVINMGNFSTVSSIIELEKGKTVHSTDTTACFDSAGKLVWSTVFGNHFGRSHMRTIALDKDQNLYIGGAFGGGTAHVGNQVLKAQAWTNAFLFKVSSTGKRLSMNVFQGKHPGVILSIASDKQGRTFVLGRFEDSINVGSKQLQLPASGITGWETRAMLLFSIDSQNNLP